MLLLFIDGTVVGTNVETDAGANTPFTFYGNGCENEWVNDDPPYYGGSNKACATRLVNTEDGESQYIGVYYSFYAATAGTGGTTLETDNTNTPDTFCPLGWQLPYGGTGGDYYNKSRSWIFLFNKYGLTHGSSSVKVKSYPLSYIPSGRYYLATKALYQMNNSGNYHSLTNQGTWNMYILAFYPQLIAADLPLLSGKSNTMPFRCDFDISN